MPEILTDQNSSAAEARIEGAHCITQAKKRPSSNNP